MADLGQYIQDEPLCSLTDPYRCGPCQKLAHMDEQIREAAKALVRLKQERQKLKEQAHRKHNHEPYIHRLPPEIIANIFTLCISDNAQTMRVPSLLSAICGRWRNIAHSTPQLWNNLGLMFNFQFSRLRCILPPAFVREWIRRSGGLPLSISFCSNIESNNFQYHEKAGHIDHMFEILNTLNECSSRWQRLTYSGPPQLLSLFSSSEQNLPNLHTLHLMIGSLRFVSQPIINLRPAKLRTLSIFGTTLSTTFGFDWNYLAQLTLSGILLSECIDALRRAPHLTQCTFKSIRRAHADEVQSPLPAVPIVHPKIQHMQLSHYYTLNRILEYVTCPSLTTLVLEDTTDWEDEPEPPAEMPLLFEFLKRSKCSLINLSFIGEFSLFNESNITASLYEMLPKLENLHLSLGQMWRIKAFTPLTEFSTEVDGKREPRYLPSLRLLTLDIHEFQDWQTIPDIFGIRSRGKENSMELHRNSVKSIEICVSHYGLGLSKNDTIDEETLWRILWLRDSAGVKWKIQNFWKDLIAHAVQDQLEYHGGQIAASEVVQAWVFDEYHPVLLL